MNNKIKLIILMVLFTCSSTVFSSQEIIAKEANQLKDIATPLKGADPTLPDDSDLTALDKVIGDARIIGLGEGTHGTHEFFEMKHRILQYLVQKKGFTIFSIEASMPYAYRLNDYVLNGQGDPRKLVSDFMDFFPWDTKEMLAMVEWMRAYNKTAEKKVKFTGFDMQSEPNTYKANITDRLNKAERPVESQTVDLIIKDIEPVKQKAHEYNVAAEEKERRSENVESNYLQLLTDLKERHLPDDEFKKEAAKLELDYKNEISKINDEFDRHMHSIKEEVNALVLTLNAGIDTLVNDIVSNKTLFVNKLGTDEYEWMLENIHLIKEYLERQSSFDQMDTRDKLMAKNILWIAQQNPGSKLVLWAHNGHIGHSDLYPSMGKYLQNELADNYRAIGFLTYNGKYTAISTSGSTPKLGAFDLQTPPDDAMESIIDKLDTSTLLLNFSNKNALPDFLHNVILTRCLWGIGTYEVPKDQQFNPPPGESFSDYVAFDYDGLIYIKTTTASQLLSPASYTIGPVTMLQKRHRMRL
jgi:erythromycin esterase